MSLAKLSIDIEARLANLQAGLDKAGALAEKTAARINDAFIVVGRTMGALASIVAVRQIVDAFGAVVSGVDALNDLSDATGESVEKLSALEDVALRTGTSMDTASDAVVKLNKALFDAQQNPNSVQAMAIKGLGLNIKELLALSPVERLKAVGTALNEFSGQNKLEYHLVLLGKGARELAPLLKDLAEAGDLNATVTTRQAAEAEKLNKQLFALQKNVLDFSRALSGPAVSALNDYFAVLDRLKQQKGSVFGRELLSEVEAAKLRVAVMKVEDLQEALGKDPGNRGISEALQRARADADRLLKTAFAANDQLKSLVAVDGQLESQRRQEDRGFTPETRPKLSPLTDPEAAAKAAEARRKLAEFSAQQVVAVEQQAAQDAADAWKFWEKQQLDIAKERADAYKTQWQQVFDFIDAEQEREIQEGQAVLHQGDAAQDALRDAKALGDEVGLVFVSAAGDAITHWTNFRDLLKGIAQDLAQITLRETVTKPLGGMLGDFFKGIGGQLGGAGGFLEGLNLGQYFGINFAHGGAFDAHGLARFAAGDVFGSPTLFRYGGGRTGVMGEAGPEAIMPLKRGADGRLGVAGGGGGTSVHIAINLAPGASVDDWNRSKRAIASDLQRSLRRAGAIA